MILKNFYLNNNSIFETVNDKKFCSKNVYGKFLIRSSILKNKKLLFLDNGENFFHIKEKTVKSRLNFFFKKNILGHSFRVKNNTYTNKQNKSIKFKYFSFYNYKKRPLEKLNNFFYSLKNKNKIALIFIQAIKGGFLCYFSGIICFIGDYQIHKYIKAQTTFFLKNQSFLDMLKHLLYSNTNFIYYPWYLSRFKLQLVYTKKKKLKTPKRKFYILQFRVNFNQHIVKKPLSKVAPINFINKKILK
tara:strand:- start:16189 stop:16923 length:735 start_codon:yes stop_codon:yes gene_type:complete